MTDANSTIYYGGGCMPGNAPGNARCAASLFDPEGQANGGTDLGCPGTKWWNCPTPSMGTPSFLSCR